MKNLTLNCESLPRWIAFLCAFTAVLSFSSCKKSENGDNNSASSRAKFLVAGKWTLTETHIQQKDGSWQLQPKSPYETTLEFRDDKTVTVMSGASTVIRGWLLSGDNSKLTITKTSGSADTFDIAQLTLNVLQIIPAGYSPDDYLHKRETYSR